MSLLTLTVFIFFAGAVGGIVNAMLSENGFLMPKCEAVGGNRILRLGFCGNIVISGIAACISWGLYGPFAGKPIWGGHPSGNVLSHPELGLTLSALFGAMLVGISGARWITNEVDKTFLHNAASEAIKAQPNPDVAAQIAKASPFAALRIVQKLK